MLLVVEDDPLLGPALTDGLRHDFVVDLVARLEDARLALETRDYELIVLDLSLPDGSGLELLHEIRERKSACGVLILTAFGRAEDRVKGLQLGADDYLTKPFALAELIARCHAILRRMHGHAAPALDIGPLHYEPAAHMVAVDGNPIALSATELRLLDILVSARGRIVSKQQIEERLYDWMGGVESNTVEVYVSRLRRKLGKDLIHTVRGLGYMLKAPA